MRDAPRSHKDQLIEILRAVAAPVSLTDLTNITGLQKTTVSSLLHDAVFWREATTWKSGIHTETYFQITARTPAVEYFRHAPWVSWTPPPPNNPRLELVGQFLLLNKLQYRC